MPGGESWESHRGDVGWGMCPTAEYTTSSNKTPSVAVGETTSINVKLRNVGKVLWGFLQ